MSPMGLQHPDQAVMFKVPSLKTHGYIKETGNMASTFAGRLQHSIQGT